jgi:hypothetical protein
MYMNTFSDGGFVIHGIPPKSGKPGRISGWFDKDNSLLDLEYINKAGRTTVVKKDGDLWQYVASYGKIYHPNTQTNKG